MVLLPSLVVTTGCVTFAACGMLPASAGTAAHHALTDGRTHGHGASTDGVFTQPFTKISSFQPLTCST